MLRAPGATFTRRVLNGLDATNPSPLVLKVVKDGTTIRTDTVTSADHFFRFHVTEHGRYRLQLERAPTIEVVSSPIWFEAKRKRHHGHARRRLRERPD